MNLNIQNKLALVTGAGQSIGREIAISLAKEGVKVILVGRTLEKLESVNKELATPGYVYAADLMKENAVTDMIKYIQSEYGQPDILVHNLGGSFGVPALASTAEWQKVWYFNVGIAHEINLAFIPLMIEKTWGRIVHLSTLSTKTYNGYAPYVSAKCAVDGYVKSVNREVSKHNVIISAVAPGAIFTEGRHFSKLQKENPEAIQNYYKEHLPINRLGQASDIGPAVAYLCSDHASFLAGSIIGIDGGGM